MKRLVLTFAFLVMSIPAIAVSQENPDNAEQSVGPPSWVVRAWQSGERTQLAEIMPPWVKAKLEMARELGLPGPPQEAFDAWESGEGFDLPGPPDFVLELLGKPPINSTAPRWIAMRLQSAKAAGLPGPPQEVFDAWESGEGFDLPGPPDFVLDLFGR